LKAQSVENPFNFGIEDKMPGIPGDFKGDFTAGQKDRIFRLGSLIEIN
jgi:hypothetical protein